MVNISIESFVDIFEQWHTSQKSLREKRLEVNVKRCPLFPEAIENNFGGPGINFCYLFVGMEILNIVYNSMTDTLPVKKYANIMGEALQRFTEPLPNESQVGYPHFLFHGINQPTIKEIVAKMDDNGRIIHETLGTREEFIKKYSRRIVEDLTVDLCKGNTDDYWGISSQLFKWPRKTSDYLDYKAKVSFFLDQTNRRIDVITVQGQRNSEGKDFKKKGREFARLTASLGMDPRASLLRHVCDLGRQEGFRRIRVIRPTHHLMFMEDHPGFRAKYEPVILQAGIAEEKGCYLEKDLNQ